MKVNSTIYKGIEYIQVNALPPGPKGKASANDKS